MTNDQHDSGGLGSATQPLILRIWGKIPVVVRAVVLGVLITIAGAAILVIFKELNFRYAPQIPWGAGATLICLWLLWKYLGGSGWPRVTAESRRANLRANPVNGPILRWSLLAGGLAGVAVFGGYLLAMKTTELPEMVYRIPPPFDEMSLWTVMIWSLTVAIVAGVSEEAAFRGYMQRPIERRHGAPVAVVVTSVIFAALHVPQARVTVTTVLAIFAGGLMLCLLAWASRSILPGVAIHTAIDMVSVPLRNLGVMPPRPLAETGVDAALIAGLVMTIPFGVAAIWAFSRLFRIRGAVASRSNSLPPPTSDARTRGQD
jgi:membrane protease YdiL (CAAX protease family)